MALQYPETTFIYTVALISIFYGAALIILLKKLREKPEAVMARFKLNKEKACRDFRYMLIGNLSIALFMIILFAGTYTSNTTLLHMAYAGQMIGAAIVTFIVLTWVKEYAF